MSKTYIYQLLIYIYIYISTKHIYTFPPRFRFSRSAAHRSFQEVGFIERNEMKKGKHLRPWRLTWNIVMEVFKVIFLSYMGDFLVPC